MPPELSEMRMAFPYQVNASLLPTDPEAAVL
jgi:hypothetical protein